MIEDKFRMGNARDLGIGGATELEKNVEYDHALAGFEDVARDAGMVPNLAKARVLEFLAHLYDRVAKMAEFELLHGGRRGGIERSWGRGLHAPCLQHRECAGRELRDVEFGMARCRGCRM
jgi:hypothetical protein